MFSLFQVFSSCCRGKLSAWPRLGSHFTVKRGMDLLQLSSLQYFTKHLVPLQTHTSFQNEILTKYNITAVVRKRPMQLCRQMSFINGNNAVQKDNVQTTMQITLLAIYIPVSQSFFSKQANWLD